MFTIEELALIPKLCDLAVRQGGLEVAEAAIIVSRKAQQLRQQFVARNDAVAQARDKAAQDRQDAG